MKITAQKNLRMRDGRCWVSWLGVKKEGEVGIMLDGIFAPVASGSRVCVSEKPDVVVNIALATFTTASSMFIILEQHRS